jgi:hypothetical protein
MVAGGAALHAQGATVKIGGDRGATLEHDRVVDAPQMPADGVADLDDQHQFATARSRDPGGPGHLGPYAIDVVAQAHRVHPQRVCRGCAQRALAQLANPQPVRRQLRPLSGAIDWMP